MPVKRVSVILFWAVVLVLLAVVASRAQEVPEAPTPQPRTADRAFYVAVVPLWAASAADAVSTNRAIATGLCYEVNPILGSRPKVGTVWMFSVATAGVYTALTYWLKSKADARVRRGRAWAIPAYAMTAVHAAATANNLARCR
jgi:hypothetical protein